MASATISDIYADINRDQKEIIESREETIKYDFEINKVQAKLKALKRKRKMRKDALLTNKNGRATSRDYHTHTTNNYIRDPLRLYFEHSRKRDYSASRSSRDNSSQSSRNYFYPKTKNQNYSYIDRNQHFYETEGDKRNKSFNNTRSDISYYSRRQFHPGKKLRKNIKLKKIESSEGLLVDKFSVTNNLMNKIKL